MKKILILFYLFLIFSNTNASEKISHRYSHFLSLYIGPNIVIGDWDFGVNTKLNWEMRKESEDLGFGVFGEVNFGKYTDFSFGFPVFWHNAFVENLFFFIAPGIFFTKNIDYSPPFMIPEYEATTQVELFKNEYRGNFMLKLGAGWDFPIQSNGINIMLISPHFNLSFINEAKLYLNLGISAVMIIR